MNKLRERFVPYCDTVAMVKEVNAEFCEHITDDYSIKFLIWIATDNNIPIIKEGVSIEQHATELQQYFKENVYNK